MPGNPAGCRSCPLCWESNHSCGRNPKTLQGRCRRCQVQIKVGQNDAAESIRRAEQFPQNEIEKKLREISGQQFGRSLDTHGLDPSALHLDILRKYSAKSNRALDANHKSSPAVQDSFEKYPKPPFIAESSLDHHETPSSEVKISLEFCGPFTAKNIGLVARLDEVIMEKFSGQLRSKTAESKLIEYVALAGGYLHILFSSVEIQKQVRTYVDGNYDGNDHSGDSIDLHLRFLLMCRCGELIAKVMKDLRSGSLRNVHAYAAAGPLHFEVKHFNRSLRNGSLSTQALPDLDGPFLDWLTSIEFELKNRLVEGCARFLNWGSVIGGSLKDFKNLRHKVEILTIQVCFLQKKSGPQRLEQFYNDLNLPNHPSPGEGSPYGIVYSPQKYGNMAELSTSIEHNPSHGTVHSLNAWNLPNQRSPDDYNVYGMAHSPPNDLNLRDQLCLGESTFRNATADSPLEISSYASQRSHSSSLGYLDPGVQPPEEPFMAMACSPHIQTPRRPDSVEYNVCQGMTNSTPPMTLSSSQRSQSSTLGCFDTGVLPAEKSSLAVTRYAHPQTSTNTLDGFGFQFTDDWSTDIFFLENTSHDFGAEAYSDSNYVSMSRISYGKGTAQPPPQHMYNPHYGSTSQSSNGKPSLQSSSQLMECSQCAYASQTSNGKATMHSLSQPMQYPHYVSGDSSGKASLHSSYAGDFPLYTSTTDLPDTTLSVDPRLLSSNFNTPTITHSELSEPNSY